MNYNIPTRLTDYNKIDIAVNIKAHDYGKHTFEFSLEQIEFDYAVLKFKRQDGEVIAYDFEGPTFVLNGAEIDISGYVVAEISFFDGKGRITTNTFTLCIQSDINTEDTITKTPKKQLLDQLLEEINKSEKQREEAEKLRDEKIKDFEERVDFSIQQAILDSWSEVLEP